MTHTPGPWKQLGITIYSESEGVSIALMSNRATNTASDKPLEISNRFWDSAMADANLITAAPELLEALEKMVANCEVCEGLGEIEYQPSGIDGYLPTGDANFIHEDCPKCSAARAIIAKAKGETS